jgi:hypothetical protein
MKKQLYSRLPEGLLKKLKDYAKENETTIERVLEIALKEFMGRKVILPQGGRDAQNPS